MRRRKELEGNERIQSSASLNGQPRTAFEGSPPQAARSHPHRLWRHGRDRRARQLRCGATRLLRPGEAPGARARTLPDARHSIEDDLRAAMGVDVVGVFSRNTMFGFPAERWKSWSFNGLEVLVPGDFNTAVDAKGDTLIYPEGDMAAPPAAACRGRLFLRLHRSPGAGGRREAESGRQPGGVSAHLASRISIIWRRAAREAAATGAGVIARLWRHGVWRHRAGSGAVPQASQGHSRHDRVVRLHKQPPGLHPQGLRAPVRDRASRIWRRFMPLSATRCRRSSSAARISARRPPRSAR